MFDPHLSSLWRQQHRNSSTSCLAGTKFATKLFMNRYIILLRGSRLYAFGKDDKDNDDSSPTQLNFKPSSYVVECFDLYADRYLHIGFKGILFSPAAFRLAIISLQSILCWE